MVNYLELDAKMIRENLPSEISVPEGSGHLFLLYAVLMRAKGAETTASDVHDAWSAWMMAKDPEHESILPFDELDAETRCEDSPFLRAIKRAAIHRAKTA